MLALAAGGFWALYIVLAQKAGAELGTRTTAYGMAIAAVLVLPFGVAQAGPALLAPSILVSALLVGLFSSALPFFLEMVALTRMPARIYGTLTCLEPALGALAGFLFLHETLTAPQLAGIAAVIAAAFGTALVATVLFGVLTIRNPEAARVFATMIQQRHATTGLPPQQLAAIQADIAIAFRAAFLCMALFTTAGFLLALTNPLRRI